MIVLDTNVVIYYIQDEPRAVRLLDRLRSRGEQFAISTITITELLSFPRITPEEAFLIERWTRSLVIADVDVSIARTAAGLRREHRITAVDAVIAGTAHILKAKLLTNDRKLLRLREVEVVHL